MHFQPQSSVARWRSAQRGPLRRAVYAIALRAPQIDEDDALLLALRDVRLSTLSEHEQRQIFALVWQRSRYLHNSSSTASN